MQNQKYENKMTDEQINIAIAEACGWSNIQDSDYKPFGKAQLVGRHPSGSYQNLLRLPDYLNDLNAMHEAWETLTLAKKRQFETELYRVIICDGDYNRNDDAMKITNATARQRAEALLETLAPRKQ